MGTLCVLGCEGYTYGWGPALCKSHQCDNWISWPTESLTHFRLPIEVKWLLYVKRPPISGFEITIITISNPMPTKLGEHFPILSSLIWTLDTCTTHNTNSVTDPAPDLEIGIIPWQKAGAKWQLLSTTLTHTIAMVCEIDSEWTHLWSQTLTLFSYPKSVWCCT